MIFLKEYFQKVNFEGKKLAHYEENMLNYPACKELTPHFSLKKVLHVVWCSEA